MKPGSDMESAKMIVGYHKSSYTMIFKAPMYPTPEV
jgi:hypothetical protein